MNARNFDEDKEIDKNHLEALQIDDMVRSIQIYC